MFLTSNDTCLFCYMTQWGLKVAFFEKMQGMEATNNNILILKKITQSHIDACLMFQHLSL